MRNGTRLSTKQTICSGAKGVNEHWNSRSSLDGGDTMIFDATVAAISRQSPAIVNTIGPLKIDVPGLETIPLLQLWEDKCNDFILEVMEGKGM